MSIRCTHKDSSGKECGYVNADGNAYCTKCGSLLDGKERKVVVEKDYRELVEKAKSTEVLFDEVYQKLQTIYKEGYAPKGYHLEKDKSIWEKYSHKTLSITEYNRLLERANQSWWMRLKNTVKEWWVDIGEIISYLLAFGVFVCGTIWFVVENVVSSCSNKSAVIKIEQRDGLWGIAKGNDIILPFEYDSIVADKYDTIYSRIYKGGMVGLVDNQSGNTIAQCSFLQIGNKGMRDLGGKLIGVQKSNGKWSFVNREGKEIGEEFDYARWFTDRELGDIGRKDNSGKMYYGYIGANGVVKIRCRYVDSYAFNEGLAMVKLSGTSPWKCIDTNEEEQFVLRYRIHNGFSDSLMAVSDNYQWSKNTRFGFVDRKGNLVIDMYYTPYLFEDGSFYYPRFNNNRAYVRYNGRNGYIDKSGKFTEEQ